MRSPRCFMARSIGAVIFRVRIAGGAILDASERGLQSACLVAQLWLCKDRDAGLAIPGLKRAEARAPVEVVVCGAFFRLSFEANQEFFGCDGGSSNFADNNASGVIGNDGGFDRRSACSDGQC